MSGRWGEMATTGPSSDSTPMDVLDLPTIARRTGGTALLGKSRRFAAVLALGFPVLATVVILGGLIKIFEQPEEALTHPLFVIMLVPGSAVLGLWIRRYTRPALKAFTGESQVRIEHGQIAILGRSFPLTPNMKLRYDRSVIELVNGGEVLARMPGFFVRIIAQDDP